MLHWQLMADICVGELHPHTSLGNHNNNNNNQVHLYHAQADSLSSVFQFGLGNNNTNNNSNSAATSINYAVMFCLLPAAALACSFVILPRHRLFTVACAIRLLA
ncbi:unnamed protein product [Polarella glacialis]|uniref:Uncharacterized protein n=1 Tax=Polarella glacialis TaxID=89957 RepID=A0A813EK98_POLGL|nr:unnamed protein product [Polarella glacialis]CAE8712027.1 unnamed protein product [Polarella glacialis]